MPDDHNSMITKRILLLLEETFEDARGYYLSKGTTFLETLRGLDCEKASAKFENADETIVGHVRHVILGLCYTQDFLLKKDLDGYDWGKSWQDSVDQEGWGTLILELEEEYRGIRQFSEKVENWLEGNYLDLMIGAIAHGAYHLAIIRQHIGS